MAKIEGTQDIPSALLDKYRATLGEQTPENVVGKRYPYRVPTIQDGRGNVSTEQRKQRDRFILARDNFKKISAADKARWYDAMPPYSSFLWYYNYFIMSDLTGNADIGHGGVGVIKSIQFKTIAMPAGTGEGEIAITAVDPAKTVVMLFGASNIPYMEDVYPGNMPIYPYISSMAAELVKCKWSIAAAKGINTYAADIGITVIEYI